MGEFDEELDPADRSMMALYEEKGIRYYSESDPREQAKIWSVRESMLLTIQRERENPEQKFLCFADDLGVPPENLSPRGRELLI